MSTTCGVKWKYGNSRSEAKNDGPTSYLEALISLLTHLKIQTLSNIIQEVH